MWLLVQRKYSAVEVEVKCANGEKIHRPARNDTSQSNRPLLTDGDADVIIRYALPYVRQRFCHLVSSYITGAVMMSMLL